MPVLEPSDTQEAYEMAKRAFTLSEEFGCPVLLRLTTRICHVKGTLTVGTRTEVPATGFHHDPNRWVMTPRTAQMRLPGYHERDIKLRAAAESSDLNMVVDGPDRSIGFVSSGPAFRHVQESFPDAPALKLGFSHPLAVEKIRAFAATVDVLVVAEEVEPLVEMELRANGVDVRGKDLLPRIGELMPNVLRQGLAPLTGAPVGDVPAEALKPVQADLFPRPPTMCPGCPHLGVSVTLSRLRKALTILGDIGCYALMYGPPWNAMDTAICMGSSMGLSLGVSKGKGAADPKKRTVAVIGDSTFLHTSMPGLLDIVYNRGNVTVVIADNRAVGMTGGQDHPGSGRDIHGQEAPRVDFGKLVEALGVRKERIHVLDAYELPTLFKTMRREIDIPEPSVIVTNEPCVLIDRFKPRPPVAVIDEACTGCANCLDVGCPLIFVTRRGTETKPNGKEVDLAWVGIESDLCTGCDLCTASCAYDAIVPMAGVLPGQKIAEKAMAGEPA